MKLAILKFIVYFMGLLLVLTLIFLGYMIAQKVKNPDWKPFQESIQTSHNTKSTKPFTWPQECLNEKRQITLLNKDYFIISNNQCSFYDIFDFQGRFINRIELGEN